MNIKGLIKTSFMDWDGKIVSVIFLPGCTFRCPFCHNFELVLEPEGLETLPWKGVKSYLKENSDFLDGVCITGGEPTLTKELPQLCREIKETGLKVKLDSNGTNPEMLKRMIDEKLIDFIAMDIKMPFKKYPVACGVKDEKLITATKKSAELIMNSEVDYEFRTTVVPTIHTPELIEQATRQIKGAKKYVIQNFLAERTMNPRLQEQKPFSKEEIDLFIHAAKKNIDNVSFRGKA